MARRVTFLHAADLHLGAPFRGLRALSPAWADRLVGAIAQAYDRVIDLAVERSVDFVVIAGDIFDEARASYADYRCFFKGLERLQVAGIPAYLCTGNHDPHASWQQDFFALPENVTMFSADEPSFALYERDGEPLCVLGGRSFPNSVWPAQKRFAEGITRVAADGALGERAQAAPFGVGVLHTGLDVDKLKAPADPQELLRAGFDYWALGHIHKCFVDDERNPRLVFPGCIQGRDVKETGWRGVGVVTLTEGEPNRVEFVSTASVTWEKLTVDVGECSNIPVVVDKIMRAQFAANGQVQCEEMVSRITLAGTTPLHAMLAQPGVLEDVRAAANESYAEFFIDALIDETKNPLDRDALMNEGLFPAVFMRAAQALHDDPDEEIAYVQNEFVKRGLSVSASSLADMRRLSDEAEELVLDALLQGGAL